MAAFSPYTAICVLIDPGFVAHRSFGAGGTFDPTSAGGYAPWVGRMITFFAVMAASGAYCGLVYGMYKSMVKNFDMIIRRQHQ